MFEVVYKRLQPITNFYDGIAVSECSGGFQPTHPAQGSEPMEALPRPRMPDFRVENDTSSDFSAFAPRTVRRVPGLSSPCPAPLPAPTTDTVSPTLADGNVFSEQVPSCSAPASASWQAGRDPVEVSAPFLQPASPHPPVIPSFNPPPIPPVYRPAVPSPPSSVFGVGRPAGPPRPPVMATGAVPSPPSSVAVVGRPAGPPRPPVVHRPAAPSPSSSVPVVGRPAGPPRPPVMATGAVPSPPSSVFGVGRPAGPPRPPVTATGAVPSPPSSVPVVVRPAGPPRPPVTATGAVPAPPSSVPVAGRPAGPPTPPTGAVPSPPSSVFGVGRPAGPPRPPVVHRPAPPSVAAAPRVPVPSSTSRRGPSMHTSSCPPASVLISIDREDVRARLAHDIAVLTRLHPQYARFSAMLTGDAPLTSLVPAVLDTEPFLYRTLFEPLFRSLARPEADRTPVVRVVSRPALAPRPMPPPPNPRPATPAPVSPLLLSHLSTLDWNTPEIGPLEPYAYMLRAGFTPDAVLARMRSSGVDDTSINALFGQVKPPARPPRPQGSSGGGASTDETLNVRDLVCTNSPVISSLIAVNTAASVDDVVNGWKRLHAVFLYYGLSDVEDPFVKAHLRQVMVSIAWALRSRFSAEHWNRRVTASFRLAMQALAV